jgi:hypothetical protein
MIARLEPVNTRSAECAPINDESGERLIDPLTGAPAARLDGGRVVTAVPQRLLTTSALAEVTLEGSIFLPSESSRVRVYAGQDPLTKKRLTLIETIPVGPGAPKQAEH